MNLTVFLGFHASVEDDRQERYTIESQRRRLGNSYYRRHTSFSQLSYNTIAPYTARSRPINKNLLNIKNLFRKKRKVNYVT